MSKNESILAFTAESVKRAVEDAGFQFPQIGEKRVYPRVVLELLLERVWPDHLHVGPRGVLDQDPNYLHPIPYTAVMFEDSVAVYQRSKKVGEQRLAGNTSIGFGGHVTCQPDKKPMTTTELVEILVQTHHRELVEELGITQGDFHWSPLLLGEDDQDGVHLFSHVLLDFTNEVGRVHIGLLSVIELDCLDLGDANDIVEQALEDGLEWEGFVPLKELSSRLRDKSPESWTQAFIQLLEST